MEEECGICKLRREGLKKKDKCHFHRKIDAQAEEITSLKSRVSVLTEALGSLPLSHNDYCKLIMSESDPFGTWACVSDCQTRIIREALGAGGWE